MEEWLKNFREVFDHDKFCTECTDDPEPTLRGSRNHHPRPGQLNGVCKSYGRRRNRKNCSFTSFVEFYKQQRLTVLARIHRNLFEAINEDKSAYVRSILTNGCDPNAEGQSGAALHVAVTKGFVNVARVLLEHEANPDKRDLMGNTPLHLAVCVSNPLEMVRLLIGYGALVSATDVHGRTPVEIARSRLTELKQHCFNGNEELAEVIAELDQATEYPIMTECYKSINERQFMTRAEFEEFHRSRGTSPEKLEEAAGGPEVMKLMGNIEHLNIE